MIDYGCGPTGWFFLLYLNTKRTITRFALVYLNTRPFRFGRNESKTRFFIGKLSIEFSRYKRIGND